ncbi:hypothetical protein CFP65_3491 [Kitasatospora sp. MMS16-BH015]|uniref:hypothetical protein n=1 Tax=Kitasatospora sp. MMS16-BH015 TaxID=2018025 RepID=UPI000CA200B6|nr:hypothetical protein [Kitasatospora sp. MMS16-BH015]AUG78283.1 hypothetical protein CFP65_3491 [Kitasatospora sp. MMS16-BH015]
MIHNDVAPRTLRPIPARALVARSLTPRSPEPAAALAEQYTQRLLERELGRHLEGGR